MATAFASVYSTACLDLQVPALQVVDICDKKELPKGPKLYFSHVEGREERRVFVKDLDLTVPLVESVFHPTIANVSLITDIWYII